ncbi:hypothetical protein J4211_03085 [Candidatus Woesearchaeota archaeon]|nr:hypothetical protein [Candidatus Woesearchaeota archaeon]
MDVSSDVNTVFAYTNPAHKFHTPVSLHMAKRKRHHYVLLAKVNSSFLYTYTNLLTDCGNIIVQAITGFREEREKANAKNPLSAFSISAIVNSKIKELLEEYNDKYSNFNIKSTKEYIDLLLTKFSIPELYENDKALGEFREQYLMEADKRAFEALNKFVRFFQHYDLMKIEEYENYENWLKKIKDSSQDVFENKQDFEDMKIAAELLSYNEELGKLSFFTCDFNMHKSILTVAKENKQNVGDIEIIKK